ncbi:hypothetical protein ACFV19_30365 [Streptomyces griseoluteus]|uniref:hypothetical protein n=1 Tax=Streptomyces griseoluteus TaxID=29306 RepID=UPI0036888A31
METQNWRLIAIAWRRPDLAGTILAGVPWYVLHTTPGVQEIVAATAALLVLRCVRIHRPARSRR